MRTKRTSFHPGMTQLCVDLFQEIDKSKFIIGRAEDEDQTRPRSTQCWHSSAAQLSSRKLFQQHSKPKENRRKTPARNKPQLSDEKFTEKCVCVQIEMENMPKPRGKHTHTQTHAHKEN